jgi:hypothetical protein
MTLLDAMPLSVVNKAIEESAQRSLAATPWNMMKDCNDRSVAMRDKTSGRSGEPAAHLAWRDAGM